MQLSHYSLSHSSFRRCYEFLDLLLQEWQTHSLERYEERGTIGITLLVSVALPYVLCPSLSQACSSFGGQHKEGNQRC